MSPAEGIYPSRLGQTNIIQAHRVCGIRIGGLQEFRRQTHSLNCAIGGTFHTRVLVGSTVRLVTHDSRPFYFPNFAFIEMVARSSCETTQLVLARTVASMNSLWVTLGRVAMTFK